MFGGLIDNMDTEKWEEIDGANKKGDFKDFHVNHSHKQLDDKTFRYMIATEDGDPKTVDLKDTLKGKNPLKGIGAVELLLSADENEIIGIDLNGDIVVRKS